MNTLNETVISPEQMKMLREMGLAAGYEPVPDFLQQKAEALLKGRAVADMDDDMKRRIRNRHKRLRKLGVPGY